MAELEEKLGAILNDPKMMQTIFAMAQSLGQDSASSEPSIKQSAAFPEIDPGVLQKIGSLASQSGIDPQQRALLSALSPFLSQNRMHKLEKAMRAARMARMASSFLNAGGLSLLTGR